MYISSSSSSFYELAREREGKFSDHLHLLLLVFFGIFLGKKKRKERRRRRERKQNLWDAS